MQHCPTGEEACCLNLLFPYLLELRIEKVEDQTDDVLPTEWSRAAEVACHRRRLASAQINRRYRRRHDLATGGRAVVIDLEARPVF